MVVFGKTSVRLKLNVYELGIKARKRGHSEPYKNPKSEKKKANILQSLSFFFLSRPDGILVHNYGL
jgi:hypothetical protein